MENLNANDLGLIVTALKHFSVDLKGKEKEDCDRLIEYFENKQYR